MPAEVNRRNVVAHRGPTGNGINTGAHDEVRAILHDAGHDVREAGRRWGQPEELQVEVGQAGAVPEHRLREAMEPPVVTRHVVVRGAFVAIEDVRAEHPHAVGGRDHGADRSMNDTSEAIV